MSDATLNRFLAYGTNAQRLAFTPSPPSPASGPSPLYIWYETDTQTWWEFDTAWHTLGTLGGALTLTGAISPTSLGADQNNYNPSGLASASILRLTASLAVNITGLVAPSLGGQVLLVANIGASAITLKTESASSTAANRFDLTADLTLAASQACLLFYDATSARWRLAGGGGGGGGGSGTVTSVGLTSGNLTITGSPVTTSGTLTADIPANGVGNSLLRQSGALSVVGRSANSTGNVADIQATANSFATFREGGGTLSFTSLPREGAVTKPLAAAFTWVNQGDATISDGAAGLIFTGPANASLNVRQIVQAAPVAPFDVVMRLDSLSTEVATTAHMLLVRNSTNGRFVEIEFSSKSPFLPNYGAARWLSGTSFSASLFSVNTMVYPQWLRMNVTSTTITFYLSPNGLDWMQIGTEALASFLTAAGGSADQIGIGQRVDNGATWALISSFGTTLPT